MMGIIKKIELSMYQNVQKRTLSAINYWRTIDQVMHFEKVLLIKIEKITATHYKIKSKRGDKPQGFTRIQIEVME